MILLICGVLFICIPTKSCSMYTILFYFFGIHSRPHWPNQSHLRHLQERMPAPRQTLESLIRNPSAAVPMAMETAVLLEPVAQQAKQVVDLPAPLVHPVTVQQGQLAQLERRRGRKTKKKKRIRTRNVQTLLPTNWVALARAWAVS